MRVPTGNLHLDELSGTQERPLPMNSQKELVKQRLEEKLTRECGTTLIDASYLPYSQVCEAIHDAAKQATRWASPCIGGTSRRQMSMASGQRG